jgi:hypothetical protein
MIKISIVIIHLHVVAFNEVFDSLLQYLHIEWESDKALNFLDEVIVQTLLSRFHGSHDCSVNKVFAFMNDLFVDYFSFLFALFLLK